MATVTKQKKCRACGSKDINKILSLGKHYLSYFLDTSRKPPKFTLELILCGSCYLVQLRHTVSQSMLYTERYGYKSGINKTMRNELGEIVNKALRKIDINGKIVVLDVGANDGTLLSFYDSGIFKIAVEPIKKFAKECKSYADIVVNDFFNYKSYSKKLKNRKAHIITAISCFYDIDNPSQFLSDIKTILDKNGVFIVQQNYLVSMLSQNAFDNVVHEHLAYYSLLSLENLLKSHDLEIFDVELSSINGGSFRTYICHKGKKKVKNSVVKLRISESKLRLNEKKIYDNFAKRIKKNKENLHKFIQKLVSKGKKIYVYGASTRGNTLLQYYKLDNNLIKAAVERNSEKWGKKIASVGIPIISEEQARREKPDFMLVLPWFFKEEFLKREKKYLESGGHFIFPLPDIKVV